MNLYINLKLIQFLSWHIPHWGTLKSPITISSRIPYYKYELNIVAKISNYTTLLIYYTIVQICYVNG